MNSTTKQGVHWHAKRLALDIPNRILDRTKNHDHKAGPADTARDPIAKAIQQFRVASVQALHQRADRFPGTIAVAGNCWRLDAAIADMRLERGADEQRLEPVHDSRCQFRDVHARIRLT